MRGLILPLKFTQPVEITKNFDTHISKKYGKEALQNIHQTFAEMDKLRSKLDFSTMQAQLNNDYRLAADFETQIIAYIRYVYLIDNFFKSDFPESRTLKINFPWTDSFQPKGKVKAINHIKYELACCLYNLAMCYYSEGIHFTAAPEIPNKLKGTTKLRSALWCINEIKQILPSLLVNPSDIPSDLNLSYINLLQNYFIGLTYSALVEVMGTDTSKNPREKLATVNKAAAKHFQIAYDIIAAMKPSPFPEDKTKALKMNLLFNATMFRSEAYFHMAQTHLVKVDEEIRKGHMGFAVSYLRITQHDFDYILKLKEIDALTFDQKNSLLERAKLIKSNYDTCVLKNQKVYTQPEYAPEQLPEIAEDKTPITAIEPKDIKTKLDQERNFEVFLSPEIIAIKSDFMNYVSAKMLDVENSLKNANNVKNKVYSEAYVNYLLDLESQTGNSKFDIPPQLKAKIEKFKKNGGVNAYLFTKKNIGETSTNCSNMLQNIKGPLGNEKDEDEKLRKQYPSQWNRAYSEQVNQEYVFKLRDLEQKFFIAQNTDKDVFKKFDQYEEWMHKFSLPDDQILTLIPRSSDNEFIQHNKAKLSELSTYNNKVVNLMDLEKQRAYLLTMTEEFMKTDFLPSFAAINAKQVDKNAEFDKMIAPYMQKLGQIESQINEAYPILDTISNIAKQMNSTRSESNQSAIKVLEEMGTAITVINDIFNDFQQGVHFYGNLHFHLTTLQKVVSDFCLAREIEKNALLQELQAEKNYANNFNAPKPYFQENNMQFPQGQSVFVPVNNPGQGGQNQGQKPGGNYPQGGQGGQSYPQGPQGGNQNTYNTQMYNPNQGQQQYNTQMYNPNQGQTNTQMYNPNQGQTHTQMYNPNQGQTHTQMYNPNQGQTHTQMYNPNQGQTHTQMYNPNQAQGQGQQQYNNNPFNAQPVTSQMGYMPLGKPDNQEPGKFGGFGNIVESTFIGMPGQGNQGNQGNQNQGNYYNQGKGPGHY